MKCLLLGGGGKAFRSGFPICHKLRDMDFFLQPSGPKVGKPAYRVYEFYKNYLKPEIFVSLKLTCIFFDISIVAW